MAVVFCNVSHFGMADVYKCDEVGCDQFAVVGIASTPHEIKDGEYFPPRITWEACEAHMGKMIMLARDYFWSHY